MRNAYLYLLWAGLLALWPGALLAQAPPGPPAVIRIDSFPASYLLLNKGWRYHPGDNPAWAQPDVDDRGSRWYTTSWCRATAARCR